MVFNQPTPVVDDVVMAMKFEFEFVKFEFVARLRSTSIWSIEYYHYPVVQKRQNQAEKIIVFGQFWVY